MTDKVRRPFYVPSQSWSYKRGQSLMPEMQNIGGKTLLARNYVRLGTAPHDPTENAEHF